MQSAAHRPSLQPTDTLDVLTYNVFLRAPDFLFFDRQRERVGLIPNLAQGYDVLILQEAFSDAHRQSLLQGLHAAYPFHTHVLGKDRWWKLNGGVIILSKWPIEAEAQHHFGELCAGADCWASKGVVYARINKQGRRYHIFGTHTQAEIKHRAIREQQLRRIRAFIDGFGIPSTQPVLIGGDFNVDALSDAADGAYTTMQQHLNATDPGARDARKPVPTFDGLNNALVSLRVQEHLDYVLYANTHLQPLSAFNEVLIFRVDEADLSDHYAVHGHFLFERPEAD